MDSGLVAVDATSDDEFDVSGWLNGNNSVEENCDSLRPDGDPLKDDEDDDCVILDGDPDNLVERVDDRGDGGGGSGDLRIVGQKGQVACRDFPHSRHLCANFSFSTTSHAEHCNLCYCFVCDSHAPCIYWGDGVSPTDHCHATDKVEGWKAQRKSFKKTNTATLPPKHQLQHIPNLQATIIAQARPQARPVSIQPLNASSQSIHHNLAKTLHYQNRLPQPVKRVNSCGSALAPTSHTQFKRASMTQNLKTVSHTNQVCEALRQRRQHLKTVSIQPLNASSQSIHHNLTKTLHHQNRLPQPVKRVNSCGSALAPTSHTQFKRASMTQNLKTVSHTNQVREALPQIRQHLKTVSIQPLNASSQSIHHSLAKTLHHKNRLQPVKRVNSCGSALAPTSHTQFKKASMTQNLKTVSHTNQVCEALPERRQHLKTVSIQPLHASSQSIHHNLAKTLHHQNRLPQPVKRVNSCSSALATTSHTEFKRASMTQNLKTVSHTNQVCEALPPAPLASQQLPVVLPRTQHMQVQTASSTSQMHRIMPQRHQHRPQAPIVSQQLPVVSPRTQHIQVQMFSSTNQVQGAPTQIPQQLPRAPQASQLPPVALARTQHMRLQTVSSTNQMHTTLPQAPQHRHRASLASQQQHVMLPIRTQSIPVTANISQCTTAASQRTSQVSQNIPVAPQITSQASQHSTAASSDEDNIRKFHNIFAALATELGSALQDRPKHDKLKSSYHDA
ncbi:uncharacterized protein LOC109825331 isoform X2 [Asparagus officinalis]|uniref:uncharacterized protein LOC109825331 isoform X2 n=1 Tax=Asparagus officinalis TaxID=4686 RepID=UPI00098E7959|nr:uncharacterized protein LOC109825331 isoform X2 [Asparagus officinalis]